jgi:hypothetical protein
MPPCAQESTMIPRGDGSPAGRAWGAASLLSGALMLSAACAWGVTLVDKDDFKLSFGVRMQSRMEYTRVPGLGSGLKWQRDFQVRRTRLSAEGAVQGVAYKFEWKIDGTDVIGASPSAQVENAYVQFPLRDDAVQLRTGLYDLPYSRDLLTSDSKQLAVDRSLVSSVPSGYGLVDNAVGFEFLGGMNEGRAQYAVGLFDNRTIDGKFQDVPMLAGRLDFNLGSTKDVYQDAHFGDDSWYSFGVNGSVQSRLQDGSGADQGRNTAVGADGMVDVPAASGRLLVRGEVNTIGIRPPAGGSTVQTTVWMAGAGYLIADQRLQPVVRFDQTRRDQDVGGGTANTTYVGLNYFRKQHGLKVQGDLRFESGTHEALDGARLQAQVYF